MENERNGKIDRILELYTKLIGGGVIHKAAEAQNYGVNERSIQRDIEDIRNFLEVRSVEDGYIDTVKYDREQKGYCLEQCRVMKLTNSEILAICKILLDSRAFTKKEMQSMLSRLIECCVPKENADMVEYLIKNEEFHYIEPRHQTIFVDKIWEIGQAIRGCNYIEIKYLRNKDKSIVTRKLKPVAIMFSEFYFYVTAFIDDKDEVREHFDVINDAFPTIYRIDRIKELKVLDEKFYIPYSSRFEEGEFRKRVQFMYGGKLQKTKFIYSGENVEAVLDRLPTAEIIEEKDGEYTIKAETFGRGIEMWLRSQGEKVRVI